MHRRSAPALKIKKWGNSKALAPLVAIIIVILLIGGAFGAYCLLAKSSDSYSVDVSDGKVKVAVVYLYYGVNKDPAAINALKNIMETPIAGEYSVQQFYEKYGVHMSFSYYDYKVTQLYVDQLDPSDGSTQIVDSFVRYNEDKFSSIYDSADLIVWAVHGPRNMNTYGGARVVLGFSNDGVSYYITDHYWRWCAAHEIGHAFGAVDHYPVSGTDLGGTHINDAHCIMNKGGDGKCHLTTDTIFGDADLHQEGFLHLNKISKAPLGIYIGEATEVRSWWPFKVNP
ncbi:MAG: hypothetical protein SA339_08365 [Methanomassiliicoccus sp.]|nr:hypothetical protein [Methanomassiliicoccus sp.]